MYCCVAHREWPDCGLFRDAFAHHGLDRIYFTDEVRRRSSPVLIQYTGSVGCRKWPDHGLTAEEGTINDGCSGSYQMGLLYRTAETADEAHQTVSSLFVF